MSNKHQQRFWLLTFFIIGISVCTGLVLFALRQNINVFYSPTQIAQGEVNQGTYCRVGGMVKEGSFKRLDGLKVSFTLTDYAHSVDVFYEGILPDLFREGQGIVTEGQLSGEGFQASLVLAKHDENYMPKEVRDSIKVADDT